MSQGLTPPHKLQNAPLPLLATPAFFLLRHHQTDWPFQNVPCLCCGSKRNKPKRDRSPGVNPKMPLIYSLFSVPLSPGAAFAPTRLCALDARTVAVASGSGLHLARLPPPPPSALTASSSSAELRTPVMAPACRLEPLAAHAHSCEVQSIACAADGGEVAVAAVDAKGSCTVLRYSRPEWDDGTGQPTPLGAGARFRAAAPTEAGWAGVSVVGERAERVAVAHSCRGLKSH